MSRSQGRALVLGFDGLEWSVIDTLLKEGELANFRLVCSEGREWTLQTTAPPLTPAAWSTLFSGLSPSRHGVFDFTVREKGTYNFRMCRAEDRDAEMIWDTASRAGRTVVVLNVPLTHPPSPVNGVMVSGMDAPDLVNAVDSLDVLAWILSQAPGYEIDAMSHWFENREKFLSSLRVMHRERHKAALHLFHRVDPQLFVCVYVLADRVQHVEWQDPLPEIVLDAYRRLDGVVGDYLEIMNSNDTLVIVSDHGFQSMRGEICLNKILYEAGLLRLDTGYCRRIVRRYEEAMVHSRGRLDLTSQRLWELPPRAVWFDAVDWPNTRCAAYGLMGNLMVNLKGRDPRGCVSGLENADRSLDSARSAVETSLQAMGMDAEVLLHPVQWEGRGGRCQVPDATLEIDGYRIGTWGGREFQDLGGVNNNLEDHTGIHSANGVLMALGPRVNSGCAREQARAIDVTPTLFDVLRLRPNGGLPGRSILEDSDG